MTFIWIVQKFENLYNIESRIFVRTRASIKQGQVIVINARTLQGKRNISSKVYINFDFFDRSQNFAKDLKRSVRINKRRLKN